MGHSIDTSTSYIFPDILENIITGYCLGMSESEIMDVYGISHNLIILILDKYTQYL